MRRVFVLSLFFVSACSATSGVIIQKATYDGALPLLSRCQNISPQSNVESFIINSYLTTWTSSLLEGAGAGLLEGTADRGPVGDIIHNRTIVEKEGGRSLKSQEFSKRTYCRRIDAEYAEVTNFVEGLLPRLGYEIEYGDAEGGEYLTKFVTRSQSYAKWQDRFEIELNEPEGGGVGVRVIRDVFVSRQGSEYFQGTSSGHNEAWILSEIERAFN